MNFKNPVKEDWLKICLKKKSQLVQPFSHLKSEYLQDFFSFCHFKVGLITRRFLTYESIVIFGKLE